MITRILSRPSLHPRFLCDWSNTSAGRSVKVPPHRQRGVLAGPMEHYKKHTRERAGKVFGNERVLFVHLYRETVEMNVDV